MNMVSVELSTGTKWPEVLFPLKVKLPLFISKHYAIKSYGGVDVEIHIFLTSALVGGRFTPG
jgi:hypothetical protein